MKERLDKLLVVHSLAPTRQKAQALIAAGLVLVDGQAVDKAGTEVSDTAAIELKGK
ncbi:MAG TPA: S4 domain-containing protein, partial [Desulfurivibrionaceae bacterium]|nr:S4 domain-containing protein [Desulfurivibrionaceae bacterium]